MTTLFISDIHISEDYPEIYKQFLEFIKKIDHNLRKEYGERHTNITRTDDCYFYFSSQRYRALNYLLLYFSSFIKRWR